jgi:hypothetical protein
MKEGRLFRSAGATGAQAESAEIALAREPQHSLMDPADHVVDELGAFNHLFSTQEPTLDQQHLDSLAAAQLSAEVADLAGERDDFDRLLAAVEILDSASDPVPQHHTSESPAAARSQDVSPGSTAQAASVVTGLAALRAGAANEAAKRKRGLSTDGLTIHLRAAVVIIVAVTLAAGTLEALISDSIGMLTAILSILAAMGCTLALPPTEAKVAVFALPTAWLLCALLPGQMVAPTAGSLLTRELITILQVLGDNGWWIFGGTACVWAIGFITSRRARIVT